MSSNLLAELSDLFSLESLHADKRKEFDEGERLYQISQELHARCGAKLARENGCVEIAL